MNIDDMIVVDVETTGVNCHSDRITEVAIVRTNGDVLFWSLINPETTIPDDIAAITGITNEMVADAPLFAHVADTVAKLITSASAMVGYNIQFDKLFLAAELNRCGQQVRWPFSVCCKNLWTKHEPRTLTNAFTRFLGKPPTDTMHSATVDARACAQVFVAQLDTYGLWPLSVEELDPEQAFWWGPTNHVVHKNGEFRLNFGKHADTLVSHVEVSYWDWITRQNFPTHVNRLAIFMRYKARRPYERDQVYAWMAEYDKEQSGE